MAFRDMPDMIVPPSHLRCEAMTKPALDTYQVWRKQPHRCVRRATQSRAGHAVCSCHAAMKKVTYWDGQPDNFRHKRFWKWPRELRELAAAVMAKSSAL
jgi:hypothetical protein